MSDPSEGGASPTGSPRSSRLSLAIRLTVGVLALVCLAWVLAPLVGGFDQVLASRRVTPLLVVTGLGALAYALFDTFLALGWAVLTRIYGEGVGWRRAYVVFALSQWSKYLPGNVLQYVSRQALGRRAGWSHGALVQSGLLELASLVVAAAMLTGAGLALSGELLEGGPSVLVVVGLVAGLVLSPWLLDRLARRTPLGRRLLADLEPVSKTRSVRLLAAAIPFHLAFFVGAGAVLVGLVRWGWGSPEPGTWTLLGLYAGAWLAGTFALGAPAGAGVREAILVLGLEPGIGAVAASTVAVALRLVTVAGDLVMAGVGLALRERGPDEIAGSADAAGSPRD